MTENVAAWMIAGGRVPTVVSERELAHRRALRERAAAQHTSRIPAFVARFAGLFAGLFGSRDSGADPLACATCA